MRRRDGLVQPVGGDDSPKHTVVTGRKDAFVERVVRSTARSLRLATADLRLDRRPAPGCPTGSARCDMKIHRYG